MFTKSLDEVMKKENGMKILIPLFHRIIGMMFNEMKKKDINIDWYEETIGWLLAACSFEVYESPEKDFKKYTKIVDDNYKNFEDQVIYEESNKAQA